MLLCMGKNVYVFLIRSFVNLMMSGLPIWISLVLIKISCFCFIDGGFYMNTYGPEYPDWVIDRFGDDIPDWAEDRWGGDDSSQDDDDD